MAKRVKKIYAKVKSDKGFYVGDICYVLNDDIYFGVWRDKYQFEDGQCYTDDGNSFGVASTAYGDGCYVGSDGVCYGVDAGVLGVVPLELVSNIDNAKELGRVVEGAGEAVMAAKDGLFLFELPGWTEIIIETA